MKLHYTSTSPFVRTVLVTAHELGIADQIEKIETGTFLPDIIHHGVSKDNPLGKIPALVTDSGMALHDSRVICDYLCHLTNDKTLLSDDANQRYKTLTLQSLALGLCDAAVSLRYETGARPAEKQWNELITRLQHRMDDALDNINQNAAELTTLNQATIAVACALEYLDLRYPDMNWRTNRPALADFIKEFSARPSMQATQPG